MSGVAKAPRTSGGACGVPDLRSIDVPQSRRKITRYLITHMTQPLPWQL
jgi:hypothetical protein